MGAGAEGAGAERVRDSGAAPSEGAGRFSRAGRLRSACSGRHSCVRGAGVVGVAMGAVDGAGVGATTVGGRGLREATGGGAEVGSVEVGGDDGGLTGAGCALGAPRPRLLEGSLAIGSATDGRPRAEVEFTGGL